MDSKKFNIFAIIMVVIMCGFSIFMGVSNRAKDGKNGLSSYELAIKNGLISKDMTEVEYLKSLYGKDGESVTLEDIYKAYLSETGKTSEEFTMSEFIMTYYPDKIIDSETALSLIENTTQQALRSTVDICYSYSMGTPTVYGYLSGDNFIIDSAQSNRNIAVGVSAGAGVIYDFCDTDGNGEDDTAYIVTNYHVVYCDGYSNDEKYYIYYDEQTDSYFSATYDSSMIQTGRVTNSWYPQTVSFIAKSDMQEAPIHTHFLEDYGIYLYGFQSSQYRVSATFVGGSADNDIAVLKVDRFKENSNNEVLFNGNFKEADIGSSSTLTEGETIVAVGNPLLADTSDVDSSSVTSYIASAEEAFVNALCLTSTSGEICNLSETGVFMSIIDSSKTTAMRLIRVSSAINAGNSGGGLYSTTGRLVGIVNGKVESESYDNIGYAIPIDIVKNIVSQIISQCDDNNAATTRIKAITCSSLGIGVKNGKSNAHFNAATMKWELGSDVEITSVTGVARSFGLKEGDIIRSISIGEKEYEIGFDYNVGDTLLGVKTDETKIVFNILRLSGSDATELSIDVLLSAADFVEII